MMLAYLDESGFFAGTIDSEMALKQPALVTTSTMPGTTVLGPLEKWRLVDGRWVAENDYRGHHWYDPVNTESVYACARFDDVPPIGWTYWEPGQNKVVGEAQALQKAKYAQWEKVKQARAAVEYGGFTWDGSTFDSDAISQARIIGAVTLAQMNSAFSIGWTLADNSVRTLSAADMIAVGIALGQHVNACHERARVLRGEIAVAATVGELSTAK